MIRFTQPGALLFAASLIFLSILLSGCGDGRPKRVPVSGHVLIDGKPLTAGYIQIYPEHDRAATGLIESDGRFTLTTYDKGDGCVLGKHRATVTGSEPKPGAVLYLAPKKYIDPATSGLEVEITGPTDNLEVNLTWDGGKPFLEKLSGGNEGIRRWQKKPGE